MWKITSRHHVWNTNNFKPEIVAHSCPILCKTIKFLENRYQIEYKMFFKSRLWEHRGVKSIMFFSKSSRCLELMDTKNSKEKEHITDNSQIRRKYLSWITNITFAIKSSYCQLFYVKLSPRMQVLFIQLTVSVIARDCLKISKICNHQ